ncbi:ABC transporter substrate-binding protein [Mesorhizobium sp. M1329]|uniref:ABC transporter substrate-binding protein n=1 Tax=Mesorhizobium sp. M1329 TaxID=2957083 RepID=UPI00333541D4
MTSVTRKVLMGGLLALTSVAVSALSANAGNVKVRMAYLLADAMLPVIYALDEGYCAEAGIDLELIAVQGGPASMGAIASGEVTLSLYAIQNALLSRSGAGPR